MHTQFSRIAADKCLYSMEDTIDRQLIALLKKNGRLTNTEASQKLGINRIAVQRRISRLCEEGIIHVTVFVNPTKTDAPLGVVIGLEVVHSEIDKAIDTLLKHPRVGRATKTLGRFNLFVYATFIDMNEMSEFFLEVLSRMHSIRKSETFVLLHNYGNQAASREIDPRDKDIIRLLQEDGRRSAVDIAKRLGISASTVHRRIGQLQAEERILIVALVDQTKVDWYWPAALAVSVRSPCILHVRDALAQHPSVQQVFCTTGRYDLLASFESDSRESLFRIVDYEFATINGIKDYEVFVSEGGSTSQYYGPLWKKKEIMGYKAV